MAKRVKKARTPVPPDVVTQVRFAADDTCCKCRTPGRRIQIHHLDGNPSNHVSDNLVALCVSCHDVAEIRGGVARQISPELLRTYREDWLEVVAHRRAHERRHDAPIAVTFQVHPDATTDDQLDILGAIEVRKIGYAVQDAMPDWKRVEETVRGLVRYARDFRGTTRTEVLKIAYDVACDARRGMPGRTAWTITGVTSEALPLFMRARIRKQTPTELQLQHMEGGVEIGWTLVYDGTRYLHDIGVVMAGSSLLQTVLRDAVNLNLGDLRREAESQFTRAIEVAEEYSQADAARWLKFERAEAVESGSGDFESVRDIALG